MICNIHNKKLVNDKVQNRVGMPPAPPEGFYEARKTLFPHSNTFATGGCLMPQPDVVKVRFCPDCRDAEKKWQSGRDVEDFWKV